MDKMMTRPVTVSCKKEFIPIRVNPFLKTCKVIIPATAPPIVPIPPALGLIAATLIGKLMGDIFVTKEEIGGLMADLLHVPGATPTGGTRLSDWVNEHRHTLGTKYASELARRLDTTKAYSA